MSERDVSEFVILSPVAIHSALVYSRERLRSYLEVRFPRFCFSLAQMACEEPSLEFVVVPVVGNVGDEAERLQPPHEDLLREIKDALEAFEINAALLH